MLPHDSSGKSGPKLPLPDHISIADPKEDSNIPDAEAVEKAKALSAVNQIGSGSP